MGSVFSRAVTQRLGLLLGLLLFGGGLGGCQSEDPPSSYVARVGTHYLTQEKLDRMLAGMEPIPDTTEARQQVINQWITHTLLYREALRQNLESVEEVQRKLKQQRRSVLITAMVNRIHERANPAPSQEDVRTYFERHKGQLRLQEPYVTVRYMTTSTRTSAQRVRQALLASPSPPDSLWTRLVHEYAADSSRAVQLSRGFHPQSRLARQLPYSYEALSALTEGEVASLTQNSDQYHILQLVRRLPEGAEPQLSWFEDKIRQRLRIRARKQMYAREVQRLRNKARANGALETPYP